MKRFKSSYPLAYGILAAMALMSACGPVLWSWLFGITFDQQHVLEGMAAPSFVHPFGTDVFGRDLFVRTLCGLRMSFAVGLCGASVAVGMGATVGIVAAMGSARVDQWLMRAVDVLYALPFLFLAILLVTLFGRQPLLVFLALGAVGWLSTARMVRAHVAALRQQPFVDALLLLGASRTRIAWWHIVPNSTRILAVAFGVSVPAMVLEEAFLSFLGLGVQPPYASLGSLVAEGATLLRLSPWPLLFPALAMAVLLWTLQATAEALKSAATSRAS